MSDNIRNEGAPETGAANNESAGADNIVDFSEVKEKSGNKRQPQGDDVDRLIERFNRKYAVVNDGSDLRVFWERADQLRPGRYILDRFKFADFRNMHMNRLLTMQVPDPKPGAPEATKTVTKSVANWWLSDKRRREHLRGVIFDPSRQATPILGICGEILVSLRGVVAGSCCGSICSRLSALASGVILSICWTRWRSCSSTPSYRPRSRPC
jgi:hypothetical protein